VVEGSESNVVGLPLERLKRMLETELGPNLR
jgi:predicted house-cleaning NTP pyrophosphatase (Maf/HAM1 superfamily)